MPVTNFQIKAGYAYSSIHLPDLMSKRGSYFVIFIKGNIMNYDILDFLNESVKRIRRARKEKHVYIVLSNCTQHKASYMLNFAKEAKLTLIFTIPYNPQLNRVEYFFKFIKAGLCREFVLQK